MINTELEKPTGLFCFKQARIFHWRQLNLLKSGGKGEPVQQMRGLGNPPSSGKKTETMKITQKKTKTRGEGEPVEQKEV